jgi:hypothetical protein
MAKFLARTLKDLATETEHTEKRFAADWRKHLDDKRYSGSMWTMECRISVWQSISNRA